MRQRGVIAETAALIAVAGAGTLLLFLKPLSLLLPRSDNETPAPEEPHVIVDRVEFRRETQNQRNLLNSNEELLKVYIFLSPENRSTSRLFEENSDGASLSDFVITDEHAKQKNFAHLLARRGTSTLQMCSDAIMS